MASMNCVRREIGAARYHGVGMNKILLVDDNPLFRLGLREIIRSVQPKVSVLETETLFEARALLKKKKAGVSLIILDIKVRDCGGFVGLFELRKEFPHIPVMVSAVNADSESVSRAVAYGASGFISKSAPCEVVAQMLKNVLTGGHWTTGPIIARESQMSPISSLTPAQLRVLKGLKRGWRNREIASDLGLSEKTIKAYMSALYRKLGVNTRAQALVLLQKIPTDPNEPVAGDEEAAAFPLAASTR
jgi:DNA-binding NarL/FixJ family response regulator